MKKLTKKTAAQIKKKSYLCSSHKGNMTMLFWSINNRIMRCLAMIIIALLSVSCAEKQNDLAVSKDFIDDKWGRFENIEAAYTVIKAPLCVDMIMELTVTDDYPNIFSYYRNDGEFLFCMQLVTPDGGGRVKEYKFDLKNSDGSWKSEKINDCYHFCFPLINELNINEKGDCIIKIENKYSKDPLYGIRNMTIRFVPTNR